MARCLGGRPRLWVFDREIDSDDNLGLLRERGAHFLVGTPKNQLKAYEQQLLAGQWQNISDAVQVQLRPEADEVYGLCRSTGRAQKERAMRRRWQRKLSFEKARDAMYDIGYTGWMKIKPGLPPKGTKAASLRFTPPT